MLFMIGNPSFRMRTTLGEGYAEAVRAAWPEVPESVDFVMYWWHQAALLTGQGKIRRFGFITTNSLRQTFNRRVVAGHLGRQAQSPRTTPALRATPVQTTPAPGGATPCMFEVG